MYGRLNFGKFGLPMRGTRAGGAQQGPLSLRVLTPEAHPGGEETGSMDLNQALEMGRAGVAVAGGRFTPGREEREAVDPRAGGDCRSGVPGLVGSPRFRLLVFLSCPGAD